MNVEELSKFWLIVMMKVLKGEVKAVFMLSNS
jgi:hypothetical protein